MNQLYVNSGFYFNILFFIIFWLTCAQFSELLSVVIVFSTFLYLFIKSLNHYFFVLFFLLLVLSDSRLEILSFSVVVKPYIALFFGVSGVFILMKNHYKQNLLILYFIGFVISIVFSLFFSNDLLSCFQKSLSYILLMIAVPAFLTMILDKYSFAFLKLFTYAFLLILFVGIFFYFFNPDVVLLDDRYRGVYGNPNGLGIACLLFFFLLQTILMKKPNLFTQKEVIFIISLIIFNLLLSGSRSSLLVLVMYYVFLWANRISPLISTIVILFFGIGYTIILSNLMYFISLFGLESFIRIETLENASGRFIAWEFIWQKISFSFSAFGHGMGATEELYKENYDLLSIMGHQGNAHNSFLTIWYDTGILGLLGFLIGIVLSFFYSIKNSKVLPILIGVFISSFFESWLSASLNPFTIIFLMVITLFYYNEDEDEDEDEDEELVAKQLVKEIN